MADKKSILEEALLDIKNINNALNANTKEILRSVAREEIDGVVKESFKKDYEEEDVKESDETKTDSKMTEGDMSIEGMDDETPEMGSEFPSEEGMDGLPSDELDMTQASDDDVIEIYKKLSGDDEIEIVGDEVHLHIDEPGDYIVKTSDIGGEETLGGDDEAEYEIELDDDGGEEPADLVSVDDEEGEAEPSAEPEIGGEEETEPAIGGDEEEEETEIQEEKTEEEDTIEEKIGVGIGRTVGSHRNPHTAGSIGAPENPKSKLDESVAKKLVSETTKKYNTLLTEAKKLKTENEEFRKALKEFRNRLLETVVFNSNLTYVTKLFMEHTTTKGEKQNIIKRFDEEVSTIKESKKLFKTIENELAARKPIAESVENKIIKEVATGASKQLTESTAYVDPSTKRILDLIKRVETK